MKYNTPLVSLVTLGALVAAALPTVNAQNSRNSDPNARPIVMTPPAVKDGSNWSRAPFPAARPMDDTKSPDGQAVDRTAPNTPASNTEPPVPPAPIAILQPSIPSATAGAIAVFTPVSTSMDSVAFVPTIHASTYTAREQLISDIEQRVANSDAGLASYRATINQMSTDGRRAFDSAADNVKDTAKALQKSIKNARKAKDSNWEASRAELASAYEAYAAALARVDASTGATPAYR
jgi:hypothetical protein